MRYLAMMLLLSMLICYYYPARMVPGVQEEQGQPQERLVFLEKGKNRQERRTLTPQQLDEFIWRSAVLLVPMVASWN